jgi:hypothetical protein
MSITYRDLLSFLTTLNDEQLDCDVTIHDMVADEFYGSGNNITTEIAADEHQVLDGDHPIICIRE